MNYESLGNHALARLHRTTAQALHIQDQLLLTLMHDNQHTVFGSRYGFSAVHSMHAYQDAVPLTNYDDYVPYLQAMMAGQHGQLTRLDPVYYSLTSGSTGTPKYVPVSTAAMRVHYLFIYGGIYGMLRRRYPDLPSETLFGKIFQVSEFVRTHLDSGAMCGIRSSALYLWLDQNGGFDASDYCVPKEVLFPDRVEDLTYVKARFALAAPDLCGMHSVFTHRVIGMLEYIRRNWDLLLHDMANGTVDASIPLREAWRHRLCDWLPPDPSRAQALRALRIDSDPQAMICKIWPQMKYIIAIGGQRFPQYTALLGTYAPDIPVHHFIYGASEGFLSIADGFDHPDAYILLPEAGLFEFLPLDAAPGSRPLTMGEVQVGQRYELIFTNRSGLYRYRMKDVLEIVGFRGQAPVIRFCYRINQVLNVADEKTNAEQLAQAMELFEQEASVPLAGYCVQEDYSVLPGRYLFYLECPSVDHADSLIDTCMYRASMSYQSCRVSCDISLPSVRFLPPGSFARYEQSIASSGRDTGQYKPVRILDTPEKQAFFARESHSLRRCT